MRRRARRPAPPRRPHASSAPASAPPKDHPVYRDALPGPPIDKDTDVEARLEAVARGSSATTTFAEAAGF